MTIASPAAEIRLPTERPLYAPRLKPRIVDAVLEAGDETLDAAALYSETVVDKARLAGHIRHALQDRSQSRCANCAKRNPSSRVSRNSLRICSSPATTASSRLS